MILSRWAYIKFYIPLEKFLKAYFQFYVHFRKISKIYTVDKRFFNF